VVWILAVGRLPIEDEARAVMTSTPFNIEWMIQFLIPGNFTLCGVRTTNLAAHYSHTEYR
jgi:hypothetical protein